MTNDNLATQLGELKGAIAAQEANFTRWMQLWERQDMAATSSRKELHQRMDGLSKDVVGMNATLSSVKEDVEEIKTEIDVKVMPTITAYNIALAERAGMWLAGKFFWAVIIAICAVIGFALRMLMPYLPGGRFPFTH